ncbi:MAG: hypothetical protein PHX65_03005, partial [Sulfurimonas sp.]|nr:hypothetical protein [Sulfurimonas sp.]
VYVGDTKIDTVACQTLNAQNGRVFDVDVRGILYDVPDAYQEQIEDVVFKDTASGEVLPEAFVSVFRRDDEKYNELSFMKSLEESVDEEKLKALYTKDSIGFMAYEESLKDETFITCIKELYARFPQVIFKAFCLSTQQREDVETIFSKEIDRIEPIIPNNIYDIAKNIEIFLYPNHASRNIYLLLIKNTTKIACLDIMNKQKTMQEIDLENANNIIFKNPGHFEITEKEFEKYKHSYTKMIYERIYHEVASNEYAIDTSSDGYEFYLFERVRLILTVDGYKDKLINDIFRKLMS